MDNSIFICRFCGKVCKNTNSLIQHELRCYNNPDRIVENKLEIEAYEKSPKICPVCGVSIPYNKRHQKTCSYECGIILRNKNAQHTKKNKSDINTNECICKYCGKICKNSNSLRNHERLCKLNPNRQIMSYNNLENYNNNNVCRKAWNKGLTKETDVRILKEVSL